MTDFPIHTPESASQSATPMLQKAHEAFGFVPNLLGVLADSPAALEGYMTLSQLFEKTSLTADERHVVLLTISIANGCEYCVSAHTAMAKGALDDDILTALRDGTSLPDSKLEALKRFTQAVVEKRGWLEESDIRAFLDAGYRRAQILEVVLAVSMKTLSNYANHIAETPLDPAFEPVAWKRTG